MNLSSEIVRSNACRKLSKRAYGVLHHVRSRWREIQFGLAGGVFLAALLTGCSSKNPCSDPKGSSCARTNAYPDDDPHSVCHVCCEANVSYSDAWTEVSQTDIASGKFTATAAQNRPYFVGTTFTAVQAMWTGNFFSFDDNFMSNLSFGYHLLTRGRSDEGNLQVYVSRPGDYPISAAPLNCTLARN